MAFQIVTVNDLITLVLKDAGVFGVGQTPLAEDVNDTMARCNMMLASWNRKRWLVYHLVDTIVPSTGAQSYSVGTGGDINIARPDQIEAAYFRQVNIQPLQPDYPLIPVMSYEDYSRISLKQLQAFPQYYFYDSGYPLGRLYVWPIPQANLYEVHILTKDVLTQFTSLNQSFNLPPEYQALIHYNLVVRTRAAYRLPPDPAFVALAEDAIAVVTAANTQIPRLSMPADLFRRGNYDIYSDRSS